jgi:hypothetical protein
MTGDEITALSMVLAEHTGAHLMSNMQIRAMLELLKSRGYLRSPPACATCNPTKEAT